MGNHQKSCDAFDLDGLNCIPLLLLCEEMAFVKVEVCSASMAPQNTAMACVLDGWLGQIGVEASGHPGQRSSLIISRTSQNGCLQKVVIIGLGSHDHTTKVHGWQAKTCLVHLDQLQNCPDRKCALFVVRQYY